MVVNELLKEAKLWLRRSKPALDSEIIQTMSACLLDLRKTGVHDPDPSNPLIQQAIKLYLKAQFGYGDESGRFNAAYESLRDSLSLSGFYNEGEGCCGGYD